MTLAVRSSKFNGLFLLNSILKAIPYKIGTWSQTWRARSHSFFLEKLHPKIAARLFHDEYELHLAETKFH